MAGTVNNISDGKRFREIISVLTKNEITKGLSPEKVLKIIGELGPTFVKFGQILSMRSDLLPQEYCRALETLRTDALPMSTDIVKEAVSEYCGKPWDSVFSDISDTALGSASIAQVHTAHLPDGTKVVIKVQRPHIKEIMERDMKLMKKASKYAKFTPIGDIIDVGMVLDEMWKSLQEELDFTTEAENLEEFMAYNKDVAYVKCPSIYKELSNRNILVMECIDGYRINDTAGLKEAGYDFSEIATKLVNNYIKQITVDRFFHADPHPGNIKVQDGKIVWIDLGMMGRISKREANLYMGIIRTIYNNDALGLTDVFLSLGKYTHTPDRQAVCSDVEVLLAKYASMSMTDMNMGVIVTEFIDMLGQHGISVPTSLTMLGRSLLVIQGMLSEITPDLNIMEIIADYLKATVTDREFIQEKAKSVMKQIVNSGDKMTILPDQISEVLKKSTNGQITINTRQITTDAEYNLKSGLLSRIILCIIDCFLILSGSIVCLSNDFPRVIGLPWPSFVLYILALITTVVLIKQRKRKK